MGFFDIFDTNDKTKKDEKIEKKMDELGLEEWEKELVRKGEYDPESFEEEDLEEDDYYYEDN